MAGKLQGLDVAGLNHLPPATKSGRPAWLYGVLGVVLAAVGGGAYFGLSGGEDTTKGLELSPVDRGKVLLSVIEKGELEAARNTDVVCKVRSSGRGNNVASSIKWIVDDGTRVKKGELLVKLDDAGVREQYKNQEIVVDGAESLLIQAQKDREIIESQNRSDLKNAENNVKLAEIDLEKYLQGDLEQKRKDVVGRITLAESDLLQWNDKVGYSARMLKRGYLSASQAQSDEAKQQAAQIALDKVREEKRVLDSYEARRSILDLQNKLDLAKEALLVAKISAAGKMAQAMAKLSAAESVHHKERSKLDDLGEDMRNCVILAPNDGMVVYYIPEQSRFGAGSSQSIIAVGEPVKEGQKLMRIPDLRHMVVKVKIHESIVPKLRGDRMQRTPFADAVQAGWMVAQPGLTGLALVSSYLEVHSDFEELEEEVAEPGLDARIKIPSVEKPLRGRLKMVSAVASSTDWMSSDVKVYQCMVSIDENLEGLKPGMSGEVTILVDEVDNVLRIPVHAMLEAGGTRFCYVKTAGGTLEKRKLEIGLNNNKYVEVASGSEIQEGDQVVLNPRSLAERLGDLRAEYRDPADGLKNRKGGNGKGGKPAAGAGKPQGGPGAPGAAPAAGGAPRGPGGPAAQGGPGGAGGGQGVDPAQRQQMIEKSIEDFKNTPVKDRKAKLDKIPEQFRDNFKQMLKARGVEVPD